jgi:hypothetical protein
MKYIFHSACAIAHSGRQEDTECKTIYSQFQLTFHRKIPNFRRHKIKLSEPINWKSFNVVTSGRLRAPAYIFLPTFE